MRRVLVTGATGNQGAAVIKALQDLKVSEAFDILALTRNTTSPKAQALAAQGVTLIEGDFSNCEAIFASIHEPIDAVYSVQVNHKGTPEQVRHEEVEACAIIDAALKHRVSHFVQASGDRGGETRSWQDPTSVPHFATKFNIEQYLREKAAGSNMSWTILRPVTFMVSLTYQLNRRQNLTVRCQENYTADIRGRGFAAMWSNLGKKRLQLVSTVDIGVFAAKAIAEPTSSTFHNRAVSLAGDELTFDEACHVFQETYGHHAPMVPGFVGSIIQWSDKEIKSDFDWFRNVGLGADSQECKKVYPEMQDFRTWLVRTSAFGPATWKA